MKKALFKDTIKEITHNYKRFGSILLIVLLGVGFFAGIKATSPDMKNTLDTYFDDNNVMDIQVASSLGLTQDDIEELQEIEGVEEVEGSYSTDAIVEIDEKEIVVKLMSLPETINLVTVVEGRLPENNNECVVEPDFLEETGHQIGDTITVEVESAYGQELLKEKEVTIVGTVNSPLYVSSDRGTTKLGSGKISYYMYVPLDNFDTDIRTSAYITVEGAKELKTYNQEYTDLVQEVEDSIENDTWYVLDREQNVGYVSYLQETDRIANIAKVFPVVFFVVAALISLTSMTRIVEEQRVQIGTLKALGYSKLQIASKYIIYSLLATILGGLIGMTIGFYLIPKIICSMYGMMYTLPEAILEFNMYYAIVGMLIAIACTVGATIYSCVMALKNTPASLMRPKAPKPGKRVFLEKIPFIWKHFNFTKKVTARNLFRYKKRFLMTIIGVAGCTALIVAGFGLRDAVADMIPSQYGEIFKYNIEISLKDGIEQDGIQVAYENIMEQEEVTNAIKINMQSIEILKDDNNQSIQLIVPEDVNALQDFIVLRDRTEPENTYILDEQGIIITEKLATLLEIEEGDTITIKNADDVETEVEVVGITENYLYHYIYMSPELYKELYQEEIEPNTVLAITNDLTEDQEDALGKELLTSDNISGVTFTSVTEDMFTEVMDNMNVVVWILIIAAGLLALVVLYNLSNTNISERIRELATIKVLGFYNKEVYDYVSKETVVLTIIGILLGLLGGNFLTTYIIKTCELDVFMFNPEIRATSYLSGIVITGIFAIAVNISTYFTLKKIDMIESLKSVE